MLQRNHDHGREPGHEHDHDHHSHEGLSLADRHDHEAETYDAMAARLLREWDDDLYRVDPAEIPFANREHVEFLTDAVTRLGPLAGRRVLEVGAGAGSLAVWLALQGADVVGIDVSSGILEVARRRAELNGVGDRITLVTSPIEHFDPREHGLDHDRFDAIIGNNVVHHFDRDLALERLGELLEPGAVAVFCEPMLLLPEWTRRVRNSRVVVRRFPLHTHSPDERSLGAEDLATMRRWFRSVQWTPYQVLCRLQNFVELSDGVWNRLEAADRWILRRIPGASRVCRMAVITLADPVGVTRPDALSPDVDRFAASVPLNATPQESRTA